MTLPRFRVEDDFPRMKPHAPAKAFRFHPVSMYDPTDHDLEQSDYQAMYAVQKVPLSPLTLEQHDSLVPPFNHVEPSPSQSSNGMPPLTDMPSSNMSNDHDKSTRDSIHSASHTSSEWENLQIRASGRTVSLLEISHARMADAPSSARGTASIHPGVLPDDLEEIRESGEEIEIEIDAFVTPRVASTSSDATVTLLKCPSTSSTVIIHDYSRQSSVPSFGSIPFFDDVLDNIPETPVAMAAHVIEQDSMEMFRRHMTARIRTRFSSILSDLDAMIDEQKSNLLAMQM